jgi:hypothetical protein
MNTEEIVESALKLAELEEEFGACVSNVFLKG